jgi:uncharacterized protein (DUF1697 family)
MTEGGLMPKYAAFLRAINIGGRRVKSDELRSCFEAMGFSEVAVFRASGNVVFAAEHQTPSALTERIEAGLTASLGYDVVTFLRSESEVRAMAEYEPFDRAALESSDGKLQLALLLERPPGGVRKQVLAFGTDLDRLTFGDRELYWLPSGGTMESSLDRDALVRLLGPMTFRTKGTVEQIARKYFAD